MSKDENTDELIEKILERADIEHLVERVLEKRKREAKRAVPPEAWFLGPKAEHGDVWLVTIEHILRDYIHWRRNYFPEDPILVDRERLKSHEPWIETLKFEIDSILNQLKAHFPFYSPRYIAHMISEQTFPSVVGYFAGMLYNPNNVTEESAPITASLEIEVGKMIAKMLGYDPDATWAHLCSGGTIANLEALWIARMVQFVPLIVQDYCAVNDVRNFYIRMPNGERANISDLKYSELVAQKPNESIGMVRKLAKHLIESDRPRVFDDINNFLRTSRFNISNAGLHSILSETGLSPVIFVSEAAHYSMKKAVNILGYGESSLRLVPVESHFRLNTDALRSEIFGLDPDKYIAAVTGIAGTTEEGAVDPIHVISSIRNELETERNTSFWLHVDAAWGGYIRSIFSGHDLVETELSKPLDELCDVYREKIAVREETEVPVISFGGRGRSEEKRKIDLEWRDYDVYSAFLAMPDADSITVDPHKLGYIPYPAGVIAFQNKLATELVIQKAQYITDEIGGLKSVDADVDVSAVGPFIIEGSKPGAVAAACWLSHKTIPLTYPGHGRLIKTSLLNTQKLARYISLHKDLFDTIEFGLTGKTEPAGRRFTFELLSEPDTNIICFLCVPMKENKKGNLVKDPAFRLADINALNKRIYGRTTIKNAPKERKTPYSQEFFVSRTILYKDQYKPGSIADLLERFDFSIFEYEEHGIFMLRSVVMNPWHYLAEQQGKNYLYDFVVNLHQIASDILND